MLKEGRDFSALIWWGRFQLREHYVYVAQEHHTPHVLEKYAYPQGSRCDANKERKGLSNKFGPHRVNSSGCNALSLSAFTSAASACKILRHHDEARLPGNGAFVTSRTRTALVSGQEQQIFFPDLPVLGAGAAAEVGTCGWSKGLEVSGGSGLESEPPMVGYGEGGTQSELWC